MACQSCFQSLNSRAPRSARIGAGSTGQGPATLTEHTASGEQPIDLADTSPYHAMIDHVLACLAGHADSRIDPVSTLLALELTLDVHQRLTQDADPAPRSPLDRRQS